MRKSGILPRFQGYFFLLPIHLLLIHIILMQEKVYRFLIRGQLIGLRHGS